MKKYLRSVLIFSVILTLSWTGCKDKDGDFTLFSIEDDKMLGEQVSQEIAKDPVTYPVLDESHPAYTHIRRIRDNILNSGKVQYRNDFAWSVKIIKDDSTLNAFATPGGYIYVYTGLIKFLESEDELAGVMGHEIAHADKRHSTDQLTKLYGIQLLLQIALGENPGALAEIAASLATLSFGRDAERESDEMSVIYLYSTEYDARGAARFFEKLEKMGQANQGPEFLSTHPNPGNRVEDIKAKHAELGGKEGQRFVERYNGLKASLN